jgi:PAS domain S-box-containing protein
MTTPDIDDLLKRLVHQANEHAIILLDPTGQIMAWLGASEKVFGFREDEIVGHAFAELFTPEDIQKEMPQFEMEVARRDGHAENDRWMLNKDGRRFWATGVLVPIRDDQGDLLAFGKILRNRTDLKGLLEAALKRAESLQRANEGKNAFIATLAHELRNPLSTVSISIDLLEQEGNPSDHCRFARATIQRQVDHMRRMIDDLLEVVKSSVGKVQLNQQETALNDIVNAAIETCRAAIDKRTHTFALVMPDEPIIVNADSDRLRQVFINLIENATKYTQYGGNIWVKVSVEGDTAVVKVEDSGVGISSEMLPLIFDLFTQAEFSNQQSGLGIGLSVVKDLTTLHGGTVQVRSDGIGKGSEFAVRLPLAGKDSQRPNRPAR